MKRQGFKYKDSKCKQNMIIFVILFKTVCLVDINITILYEKQVEKTVKETYRIYLEQLVKSINRITEPKNIAFKLDHIYSHSDYGHLSQFDELSRYAGSENISKRIDALFETDITNFILAVSTGSDEDVKKYQIVEPCRINYILNLESDENFDRDLLTNLLYGTLDVFTKLFGFNVPNLLDMNNAGNRDEFTNNVMNSDLEHSVKKCIRKSVDVNEKTDFKSSLKENDDFVTKFDKLLSLLELNKEKKDKEEIEGVGNSKNDSKLSRDVKPNPKDKDRPRLIEGSGASSGGQNNNLGMVLKNILSGIEGLEKDVSDLKNKEKERNEGDHIRRRYGGRSMNNRFYGDFKNEEVINVPTSKVSKEIMPFQFKRGDTDIKDLKPLKN